MSFTHENIFEKGLDKKITGARLMLKFFKTKE
jgi:hypothetical protein